jgi:hypothetical protein
VWDIQHEWEMRSAYKILVRNLEGRNHIGDVGIDVGIILR